MSIVAAGALAACGGMQIPTHNGYKPKEIAPWKRPKVLKLNEKMEAKAKGDLSYPDMRRARWFEVSLPSNGQLEVALEAAVPGDREDFDLGLEVIDPRYRVIAKSDLEDEDAYELNKKKTLVDLAPGKYLIHIYLQGRLDTADFTLHAAFKPTAAAEAKTNFPADVPFVPVLPLVPIQDDTPRNYRPAATVVRVTRRRNPQAPAATPAPPPAAAVKARIINVQVVSGGTQITLGRGTTTGASDGMHGTIRGIPGSFSLDHCTERTCTATIKATPDQVKSSDGTATLTP